jgi:hypothetical protein
MMKKWGILLALAISTQSAFTCVEDGSKGFLPDNNLYISADDKNASGLTEEQFHKVIDQVSAVYEPIISSMGGTLNVERNWDDGTVNAYAMRRGGTWNVAMFGGLARHQTITADGFALVVCHEIGHHIGGAPKKGGGGMWGGGANAWASNEGQSDYFATLKCLRKAFLNDDNASILSGMEIPELVKTECEATFKGNLAEQLICQRGAMAGASVANLFAALRNLPSAPKFDTPDPAVVRKTDDNHPAAQCRLDTYFQGAICGMDDNTDVDQRDANTGVCSTANNDTKGVRPLCWFKP